MDQIKVFYYLEIDGTQNFDNVTCDTKCSVREFLNNVKKYFNAKYQEDINLEDIHCVYLKGNKIEESRKLDDYLDYLKEQIPLIILKDSTKLIENYIPLIDLDNYTNFKFLSESSWGCYVKATDKKSNKTVLIKSIQYLHGFKHLNHYKISSTLSHRAIIKILGFRYPSTEQKKMETNLPKIQYTYKGKKRYVDFTQFIVVLEFAENGGLVPILSDYLRSNGASHDKMNPTIRSKIIYGVASAMECLHQKHTLLCRFSVDDVCLDDNFEPKITGFDFLIYSDSSKHEIYEYYGNPLPLAPEIITGDEFSYPADVYSYALFLYKMFSNSIEFSDRKTIRSPQQYMMKIDKGMRPNRPESIPDSYWELIQRCWKHDASERPTFEQIVEELKKSKYAIEEYGMKTNLDELQEYQKRIDSTIQKASNSEAENSQFNNQLFIKLKSIFLPKNNDQKTLNCFIGDDEEKFHNVLSKIGEGATSITYKVVDTRTGKIMCKKILKYVENEEIAFKTLQNAIKEFEVLSQFSHPCICKALFINTSEAITDPNISMKEGSKNAVITTIALFLEYEDYSLSDCLKNMNNTLRTKIVVEIVHGMKAIHKKGLIHRDLKIENIRLNCIYEAKIIDFGLVRIHELLSDNYSFVQDTMTKGVGTFHYMSPEMLNEEDYDYKTDVYSFGVVLYYLFIGSLPKQKMKDKTSGVMITLPKQSESISKFCIELISKCLSFKPAARPTFDEILTMIRDNSYSLASYVDIGIVSRRDRELDLYEEFSQ